MSQDKERAPHLLARNFKIDAESVRMVSSATAPVGTKIEALKDPAFWAGIASQLKQRGQIEVETEDGAWLVRVYVRSAGPNWAHVEILEQYVFESAESVVAKASKTYDVNWGGPSQKFRVIRLSDKELLKSGFDTKEQANEWVAANVKAVA